MTWLKGIIQSLVHTLTSFFAGRLYEEKKSRERADRARKDAEVIDRDFDDMPIDDIREWLRNQNKHR